MSTLPDSIEAATDPAPYIRPSLIDAPLPELLARYGVELVETSVIPDAGFLGFFMAHKDGRRVLLMPEGRSEVERERMARMLLARSVDSPDVQDD